MRIRMPPSSVLCVDDYADALGVPYAMLMAGKLSEKIKAIRQALGLNQDEFADRLGVTQSTVTRWEGGSQPKSEHLHKIAALANTTTDRLLGVSEFSGPIVGDIPVVGYVGGGAEVFPFDDYAKGQGMDFVERPPGVTGDAVAVEVRGDSLYPTAENGWRLIYTGEQTVLEEEVLGKICVVQVRDGPRLVKRVVRGTKPQRYHLISTNAPMIEDAEIEWAARVKAIIPN